MSRTEMHIGKLIEIQINPPETVEDIIIRLLKRNGITEIVNLVEQFTDEFWEKFLFYKGKLYRIDDQEFEECDGLLDCKKEEDGSISYVTNFHNGGTCLLEILEEVIDKVNS